MRQKLDTAHQKRIDGLYEEAERLYREVLEEGLEPVEEAETRHGLGCTFLFTGMFEEGLCELVDAHEKNPDAPRIFLDLAKTHLMLGMCEEARPELVQIVEQFPETPEAEQAKKHLSYFE